MRAFIVPTNDNRFALRDATGATVGTYSRKSDATRGASRRGFIVVNSNGGSSF